MPPGHRQWQAGKVISEGLNWKERLKRQLTALKEKLGFVSGEIAIRKFESEEAGIYDLPGEYVQFLENPEASRRKTVRRSRDTSRCGVKPMTLCWRTTRSIG